MSVRAPTDDPITLPQRPVRSPPSPFPVMAAMAPVVASVLIWLVTRSPFALIFAALGPVIAIASVVDSRWSSSRRLRKDLAAHAIEIDRIAQLIDSRLDDERRARTAGAPGARALLRSADDAAVDSDRSVRFGRWRGAGAARTRLVLGSGTLPSMLRVDGAVDSDAVRALRTRARWISGVPVEIDAVQGIGVVGPELPARALARGLVLQLCTAMSPEVAELLVEGTGWEWTEMLPHTGEGRGAAMSIRVSDLTRVPLGTGAGASRADGGNPVVLPLVLASSLDQIPTSCGVVVELTGVATALLHRPADGSVAGSRGVSDRTLPITLELVTAAEGEASARALAALAERLGVTRPRGELPDAVTFSDAHRLAGSVGGSVPASAPRTTLAAVLGVDGSGAVVADLVRDGPHAIVGGTTGSGKSELLTTWVVSIASRYSPEDVTFLLVDFKGGSAFAPLQGLPSVVGVLTDLDDVAATRALASLSAEIVYRERMLAERGCRDISDSDGAFPRLVIVVDEFAAMLDGFPDLHALFVDIAARGRSLGMHLILCTQRPTGVVRESLLANCGLRMSLRVHNRSDSVAVVGTDAAAALPQTPPGRLILAAGGESTQLQVATVSRTELDALAERMPRRATPRRPWLDPLPNRLTLDDLEPGEGGIRFARADLPSMQRQETAVWRPESDGSVLVVGASRSGKTTVLDTVTAEGGATETPGGAFGRLIRVGTDDEETWDTVLRLAAGLRSGAYVGRTLLLIDDLDSILARLDDDYATILRDAVIELLRDGPRRSVWLMVTVQRVTGSLGALSGCAGSLLLLRLPNRQEHILAGGESASWAASRAPGNAVWNGTTVQVAVPTVDSGVAAGRHRRSATAPDYSCRDARVTIVVCPSPDRVTERIRSDNRANPDRLVRVARIGSGSRVSVDDLGLHATGASAHGPVALVGDTDEWQVQWALFAALRQSADIVFEGCSLSDYRALTRRRDLPPLVDKLGHGWHLPPGGQPRRVAIDVTSRP